MQQQKSFLIYNASAGSGKTYTLVKEYLKIILLAKSNDAYRHILAITFTNKAVHEMKSRIVGNLTEFAKKNPSSKAQFLMQDLSHDLHPMTPEQIKTKSQQIIKHIIHNYAAFDISTIDKFTHKVIRAFAHDLGLPMTFEVTIENDNLLTEAVDALIARAGEDPVLTKLLVDFTMQKTDDDKSWDISNEIFEVGKLIHNENNHSEIALLKDKTIEEFVEIKTKIQSINTALKAETILLVQKIVNLLQQNKIENSSFAYERFPKHLTYISNFDLKYNDYRFVSNDDFAIKKTAKDRSIIEALLPEFLTILPVIYTNLEKINGITAFQKNITPLSLLNTISNEFSKIQTDKNLLSIAEFNTLIHNEIQNQPAPFIYEKLGERYQHFFIDEFQDTSEMQWQNLIPLIDNATSSETNNQKGTLMIVGDPKQSIYRWRGGKAEQFIGLTKADFPFNNKEKECRNLETNHRSYSEVINFNNAFFSMMSAAFLEPNYKDLYQNSSFQKTTQKQGGFVSIAMLDADFESQEYDEDENPSDLLLQKLQYCEMTFKTIQNIKNQGFKLSDIVILTRKRADGILIANFLTQKEIPILSSETLMIQNAEEVQFVIFVLKYLKNNADEESKAQFLYFLAKNAQNQLPIHDFMADGMAQKAEKDFEEWLSQFELSFSFQNIRKKALYEMVEIIIKIMSKLLVYDTNNDKNQNFRGAYVQYFLDIVLERDIKNQAGISDFLNYWSLNGHKFSIPSPEGTDAVRIMTVHKSKGLEFPVVIFPFADENYSKKPPQKMWLDADQEDFGLSRILVNQNNSVLHCGEIAKAIFEQKKQEELLDNTNVLYVALTRAEEQLYIITKPVLPNKKGELPNNMAAFFHKFLEQSNQLVGQKSLFEFGICKKVSETKIFDNLSKKMEIVQSVLDPKSIKIAQRESQMWNTHRQEAIEYGNIIHEILSYIKSESDVDFAVLKAVESGLITSKQIEIVKQTILEIVHHPELKCCFVAENKVLNEQTIIQKQGATLKPDRMVLTNNNEVLLLDYKTGLPHAKHHLQLEQYENAIINMGFKVPKKVLVYIGEKIEVVSII